MEARKELITQCLRKWIAQRPGLEFGNYGDAKAYRSEMRSITKDRHHAETLLRQVELMDSITADALIAAAKGAYSGRLRITEEGKRITIDYCTGQYFPTEYRRAACAVLSSALWTWTREHAMPSGPNRDGDRYWESKACGGKGDFVPAGTWLRNHFKREFGRTIANRWFE